MLRSENLNLPLLSRVDTRGESQPKRRLSWLDRSRLMLGLLPVLGTVSPPVASAQRFTEPLPTPAPTPIYSAEGYVFEQPYPTHEAEPWLPPVNESLESSVSCLVTENIDARMCLDIPASAYVLTVEIRQTDRFSTDVRIDDQRTMSAEHIANFIEAAHQRNARVILKPILNLDNPGTDGWRGNIQLSKEQEAIWFENYTQALLALIPPGNTSKGPDGVVLFSELSSLQDRTHWDHVSATVAARLPQALQIVNPNWYGFPTPQPGVAPLYIPKHVSMVGVSAYYPLAPHKEYPSTDDLIQAWQAPYESLLGYDERNQIDVWIAELNAMPWKGSHIKPYDYTGPDYSQPENYCQSCQQNYLNAALTVWSGKVPITFWNASPTPRDPYVPSEHHFQIENSPAEPTIRAYLKEKRNKIWDRFMLPRRPIRF